MSLRTSGSGVIELVLTSLHPLSSSDMGQIHPHAGCCVSATMKTCCKSAEWERGDKPDLTNTSLVKSSSNHRRETSTRSSDERNATNRESSLPSSNQATDENNSRAISLETEPSDWSQSNHWPRSRLCDSCIDMGWDGES
jgi:hypothetical protein